MKLEAFRLIDLELPLVPSSPNRDWMEFFERFPYKCLPLTIANAMGWDILFNTDLELIWDGGPGTQNLKILNKSPENGWCTSHFGNGILTMNLPYMFRTPPGVDLWARGPSNQPNAKIQALEGIVETWWVPFTFTMNWKCLVVNEKITFKKGDVACRIVPYPHDYLPQFEPELRWIGEEPDLQRQYNLWTKSRGDFNREMSQKGLSGTVWQKHYHIGENYTTGEKIAGHVTAIKAADFLHDAERRTKESLGWQLSELLAEGLDNEAILRTLQDEDMRRGRGGTDVTEIRLIQAFRELWEANDQTRYAVLYSETGKMHPELFAGYEEAAKFTQGARNMEIKRLQL